MRKKEFKITPWEVKGEIDYEKLVKDFGVSEINEKIRKKLENTHPTLKRGLYFSHRDFDKWLFDFEQGEKVSVITGRGPSEKMHLGHLVPFLVAKSLQEMFNCEVFIPISDDEKFYIKPELSYKQVLKYAEDNIVDLIALGFKPGKTFIYQDFIYTKMYNYSAQIAKKITYSTAKAVFGLKPRDNIGWSFYPAMQAAHILFPQFYRGKHRVVVPVGIDQDPFIRITRDIADSFGLEKPAALHAKFIPSLYGTVKMSSSKEGAIWLHDSEKDVELKIKKYAFSGGQPTIKEHRERGGNPDIDVSFQYLKFFFESDDKKLEELERKYRQGELLTSELKEILIEKINLFLKEHQKKRESARKQVDRFILKN